jgi:hypothetical protein
VESLALEKDKHRRGWRLNLCGEESGGVEIYIPGKVVQAREYIEAKDTEEQAKHKAKEAQKVQ